MKTSVVNTDCVPIMVICWQIVSASASLNRHSDAEEVQSSLHTHTKKFCEDQRKGLDPSDTEASVHGQNSNLPHLTPRVQPWDSTIPRLLPSEEKATAAMSQCHGSEEREGGHSSFQPTSCYLIATWANDLNPPSFCVAIRKMGMLCVLTNEMEIIRPSFCGWKLWIREFIPLVTYWQLSVSSPKEHSVN